MADWARRQGISYTTAWRWVKDDAMPVPWHQTASGTILISRDAFINANSGGLTVDWYRFEDGGQMRVVDTLVAGNDVVRFGSRFPWFA